MTTLFFRISSFVIFICCFQFSSLEGRNKINLIWQCGRNGLWETDWILELLSDFEINEIMDGKYEVAMDRSVIVVGKYSGDYFKKLKENGYRFGIIHISDETYSHPTDFYRSSAFVFRNYWHKQFQSMDHVHCFPLGYKHGFACSADKIENLFSRNYTWSFAGQIIDHPTRQEMIGQMKKVPDFFFYEIFRFNDSSSLSTQDYRDVLLRSVFAPCPRGYWNLDSFRVYEALEAGCIPIVEKQPLDYFSLLFGNHPFLVVNSWSEAPGLILDLFQDPFQLEKRRQECYDWWVNLKKETRKKFKETIRETLFDPFEYVEDGFSVDPNDPAHVHLIGCSSLAENLRFCSLRDYQTISITGIVETVGWNENSDWAAIVDFLAECPDWKLTERTFDGEKRAVLKRLGSSAEEALREQAINEALKSKVILCTGPALRNKQMLLETFEKDSRAIQFKKAFVTTNDPKILGIAFPGCPTSSYLIEEKGHQLDCLNCMLSTLHDVVEDPECLDDDIVLFKHETVIIDDMYLVRKAIGKMLDGFDMVGRYWSPDHFYMTDAFFLRVGTLRQIAIDGPFVTSFNNEYRFCEEYLTKRLFNQIPRIYKVGYYHSTKKAGELGLYHVARVENSGYQYWGKSNYLSLFR